MSSEDANAPAWHIQASAPPLTVTASSSPTEHRNINLRRTQLDDSDGEKNSSRDASQSRISDHIEIPKDDTKHDPKDGDGHRRHYADRNRRNARLLQGPSLKWHKEYSDLDQQAGRVLMIDFARSDKSRSHIRKVSAQEIFHLQGLRRFYRSQSDPEPAMRVIHVQNADWAIPFFMRKFNIAAKHPHGSGSGGDGAGDFGRYLRYKNPELRGGKPFLAGRTWKVAYDPWRGVNKTSFGVDYMKSFRRRSTSGGGRGVGGVGGDGDRDRRGRDRMMQLNDFDNNDEPICAHDVYVQRLSCYIQHKQAPSENRLSRDDLPLRKHFYPPDVYGEEDDEDDTVNGIPKDKLEQHKQQRLRHLDNGNVIIIFDNSSSGNIDDTLIPARRDLECRWRRLPFHLAFESRDPVDDDDAKLALNCSKAILSDIFKAVVLTWDTFLDHAVTHMTILEDKVYERPDDESRAPELWANSSAWLKVEKLVNVHGSVMQEMRARLHELTEDVDSEDNWLEDSPADFERLTNLITEDLTKPTESLISLLYQSVSIRDSRHSLELGVSMWRLSWITFIFLPLTFIVGFFGMNVDTFSTNPSIKWYFIAAIPFMFGVLTFYFLMKRGSSDSRRRSPRERLMYETFFQEMAAQNPTLWSRNGPRDYVRVEGRFARLKWRLINYWLRPVDLVGATTTATSTTATTATTATTTAPIVRDAEDAISDGVRSALIGSGDGLSTLSRLQRYLSRRWTRQIANHVAATEDTEMGLIRMNDDEFEDLAVASGDERLSGDHHSIGEGLSEVAEILSAVAVPRAGRPGLWKMRSGEDHEHEHGHEHEHDREDHDRNDGDGHGRRNVHLNVPGTGGKGLWTSTATATSASSTDDHDHDHDHENDIDADDIPTTEIPNPVIAAAITRERARQQRLRSSSSPSPSGRGRGNRARGGSGSSGGGGGSGRNSDRMLVEEEDAEWLNERGRKGKDWLWRFGSSDDDKDKDKDKDNKEGRRSGSEGRK